MTRPDKTDWDHYYRRPNPAALITRRITASRLLRAIRRSLPPKKPGEMVVLELGGGGSSFYELMLKRLRPARYHLVDCNLGGLTMLGSSPQADSRVVCHVRDVRDCQLPLKADVVFSVGLIEHFGPEDTQRVIDTHFAHVAPGGLVIITFPTPTRLYRLARGLAEALRLWSFPDERPLTMPEVLEAVGGRGELAEQAIIWPIVYTQGLVVVQPWSAPGAGRAPGPPPDTKLRSNK
jgi:cyclopropane fatty-acyl-phospholipid synthase-like methyltransferase